MKTQYGSVKLVKFASHVYDLAAVLKAAAEWVEANEGAFVHHLGHSVDDQAEWLTLYYTPPKTSLTDGEVITNG